MNKCIADVQRNGGTGTATDVLFVASSSSVVSCMSVTAVIIGWDQFVRACPRHHCVSSCRETDAYHWATSTLRLV